MASRAGNHTELLTLPRGGQGAGRRAPNGGIPAPVVGETVSLMRWCPVCGDEMTPEFGSPCEDPIAWACRACGFLQLETGGRPRSGEQGAGVRELIPVAAAPAEAPPPPARRAGRGGGGGRRGGGQSAGVRDLTPVAAAPAEAPLPAAVRAAREVLATFGLASPVDVERVASLLGYPVEWGRRPPSERGGIARQADRDTLLLNRDYPFRSTAEWRWVLAEELAHAVLGHTARAASDAPGGAPALREPERRREERAAKAFAAELLMPAIEVRAEFGRAQPRLRQAMGQREREDLLQQVISDLAHTFQVSRTAMRIRLEDLGLLH